MTSIGEQFNKLVEAALTVEQSQPHQDENMLTVDESAKSQDFFHEYKGVGKNIQPHGLNHEILCLI